MSFRRLVYIVGRVCHFAFVLLLVVGFCQALDLARIPWLGDRLAENEKLVWIILISLLAFDQFTSPPRGYENMDPELRTELDRIPLSQLYRRPAGLIFLEVMALLAVAIMGAACLIYPIILAFSLSPDRTISDAHIWCFLWGYVCLMTAWSQLYQYIYPRR
jgi:hypothetical protein